MKFKYINDPISDATCRHAHTQKFRELILSTALSYAHPYSFKIPIIELTLKRSLGDGAAKDFSPENRKI